jgi:hypothetical protein
MQLITKQAHSLRSKFRGTYLGRNDARLTNIAMFEI